ncbi:MAG: sulfotransferase [Rhodobacter sp.]|nr:sulfotransferase [Paracoccaceae bacterium]MCC0076680.1 sulfotransferase [Rhodobacter sp.]
MTSLPVVVIGGCPRSGTTALFNVLMSDDRFAIGLERYLRHCINDTITADLWTFDRFNELRADDTHVLRTHPNWHMAEPAFERIRVNPERLAYIGDKLPRAARCYPSLFRSAPTAKLLYLLRDPLEVAASFERRAQNPQDSWRAELDHRAAVDFWNFDLARTMEFYSPARVLILPYETVFARPEAIDAIFGFLGLDISPEVRAAHEAAAKENADLRANRSQMNSAQVDFVRNHADYGTYQQLLDHAPQRCDPRPRR